MQTAKAHIKINTTDTVFKTDITPAEYIILTIEHRRNSGGEVFQSLEIQPGEAMMTKTVVEKDKDGKETSKEVTSPRTDKFEYQRLVKSYGIKRVALCFPGSVVKLPKTFEEAKGAVSIEEGQDEVVFPQDVSPLVRTEKDVLKK